MATLDASIVNIALPTLTKELGVELYRIKWVVISYLLVITCCLLPFGRVADQYGRKKTFQVGFGTFVLGSLLCGLSGSLPLLVASRILQGLGASMLMANGPAIIAAAFGQDRGKALGTLAMVVSAGLVTGPSLGGILITQFGWETIFWVNIPIGIIGILLTQFFVPKDVRTPSEAPFDWGGAFLQFVLFVGLILLVDPPAVSIATFPQLPVPRLVLGTVLLLCLSLFLQVEREARAPVFDLSLLKNRTFWSANLASFLMFVSFASITVLMPFYLEGVKGLGTHHAGLVMTAIPVTIFVVAPFAGRLSDRWGSRGLSILGASLGFLALLSMSGVAGFGVEQGTSVPFVVFFLAVIGMATGFFQSPNNNAIMSVVPGSKLGVASAFLATIRNLGLVMGTGMATALYASHARTHNGDLVGAFRFTLAAATVVQFFAMIASFGKKKGVTHVQVETKRA
jgi:EmrB/QacA subfamily drug resistance transporter